MTDQFTEACPNKLSIIVSETTNLFFVVYFCKVELPGMRSNVVAVFGKGLDKVSSVVLLRHALAP